MQIARGNRICETSLGTRLYYVHLRIYARLYLTPLMVTYVVATGPKGIFNVIQCKSGMLKVNREH